MAFKESCRIAADSPGSQLRLALSVGLVGGFVLGCREAIVSLQANAAVQPDQYLFVYLAVPILTWVALGALLLMPAALLFRRAARLPPERVLPLCMTVVTAAGLLSIIVPALMSASDLAWKVGVSVGCSLRLLMWVCGLALAAAGAALAGAAAAAYGRQLERWLPSAAVAVCTFALILMWPVVRFLATDWKLAAGPPATGPPGRSPLGRSLLPVAGDADNVPLRTIEQTSSEAPNVLLISIDTLRGDHLGSYGDRHGLTPSLDHLAREGVTFTQAITASPWTLPAMASLFTAQYPRHHGAGLITNGRTPLARSALPPKTWTLTHALHERGYRTQAIVTNPYLALRYGFGEDFDSYENITVESEAFVSFSHTTALRALTWLWPQLVVGDRGDTVSRRAVHWLGGAQAERPFFLWLHYIDPHPPYSRPGATRHKSMRGDLDLGPNSEEAAHFTLTSPDVARLRSGEIRLSVEEKEAVHDLYRAEVRSVDDAVGHVLDALTRFGLAHRTLVVLVGDHGEEFWEHGGVEHGRTVYDEVVRIPLLLRWPGHLPAGARVDALARITDVTPTILDLLGMTPPAGRDGETLLPLVHGEPSTPRVALTEDMLFAEERIGVRTADCEYVLWDSGKEEVYDLSADPQERVDLAGVAGALAPLRQLYAALTAENKSGAAAPPAAVEVNGGTAEALRALGYLN